MLEELNNLLILSKRLDNGFKDSIAKKSLDLVYTKFEQKIEQLIKSYGESEAKEFEPSEDIEEVYQRVSILLDKRDFKEIKRKDLRDIAKYCDTYTDKERFPLFCECILSEYWNKDKKICLSVFSIWVRHYKILSSRKEHIKNLLSEFLTLLLSYQRISKRQLPPTLQTISINFETYFTTPENIIIKLFSQTEFNNTNELIDKLLKYTLYNRGELFNDILFEKCLNSLNHSVKDDQSLMLFISDVLESKEFTPEKRSVLLSNLIIKSENKNLLKKPIIDYILTFKLDNNLVFGDLRIRTNEAKWAHISSEAKRLFKRWRNTEDIKFFFSLIFDDDADNLRRDFWLNYTEAIMDIKFFINDQHSSLIDRNNTHILENAGAVIGGNSSLFMMEFEVCYILVASHKGDLALRIYAKDYRLEIKPIKEHFSLSKIYLKNHSGDGAQELANIGVGNTNLHRDKLYKVTQNSNTWRHITQEFLNSEGIDGNETKNYTLTDRRYW